MGAVASLGFMSPSVGSLHDTLMMDLLPYSGQSNVPGNGLGDAPLPHHGGFSAVTSDRIAI